MISTVKDISVVVKERHLSPTAKVNRIWTERYQLRRNRLKLLSWQIEHNLLFHKNLSKRSRFSIYFELWSKFWHLLFSLPASEAQFYLLAVWHHLRHACVRLSSRQVRYWFTLGTALAIPAPSRSHHCTTVIAPDLTQATAVRAIILEPEHLLHRGEPAATCSIKYSHESNVRLTITWGCWSRLFSWMP